MPPNNETATSPTTISSNSNCNDEASALPSLKKTVPLLDTAPVRPTVDSAIPAFFKKSVSERVSEVSHRLCSSLGEPDLALLGCHQAYYDHFSK